MKGLDGVWPYNYKFGSQANCGKNHTVFLMFTMSTPLPWREGTQEKTMAERLGLGVIPGVGWSAHEVQTIARQAEEAGFGRHLRG